MDRLTKVFNFLSGRRKDDLRKMRRSWGLRSAGNKKDLIFRVLLFLKNCDDRHLGVSSEMSTNFALSQLR